MLNSINEEIAENNRDKTQQKVNTDVNFLNNDFVFLLDAEIPGHV
jgi:hypothetical protein